MAISGSPKMLAYDIAKGLVHFSLANLKKYTAQDLKVVLSNLSIAQREIRSDIIPLEDVMAVKEKNQKLQRLNQAVTVINTYAKKRRIGI